MNWKSTAVASTATTLLATWFGWTSTPPTPVASDVRAISRAARPAADADIQREAQRLQLHVRTEIEYRDPSRNPFRFGARPPAPEAARTRNSAAVPAPPVPVPVAPPVSLTLSGIAADSADGAVQRTAIITAPSGLLLVKEGDRVADYTVSHIEDGAVDLVAADGSTRRLTLTP